MSEPAGLRERKKAETRQRISDVATAMFIERGFDAVTVAEVAAAANVSKMTVFNYFPRKEDLVLDRSSEAIALLTEAVLRRGPGVTPVAAVRALILDLIARGHPLTAIGHDHRRFLRLVMGSPALQNWARYLLDQVQSALASALAGVAFTDAMSLPTNRAEARELAASAGVPVEAQMSAAMIMAVVRTAFLHAAGRQLIGDAPAQIAAEQPELVNRWFDALERALTPLQ